MRPVNLQGQEKTKYEIALGQRLKERLEMKVPMGNPPEDGRIGGIFSSVVLAEKMGGLPSALSTHNTYTRSTCTHKKALTACLCKPVKIQQTT